MPPLADKTSLRFSLDTEQAESFCIALWQQSPNPAHILAALTALESFFLATVQTPQRSGMEFTAIVRVLQKHASQAREQLLAAARLELQAAMEARNISGIARLHGSLSRNGFWQAAESAGQNMAAEKARHTADWAALWCRDAKARALAASGYPDALDFKGANVLPADYAAMSDLSACLGKEGS